MLSRVIFPLTSAPHTVLCRGPPAWLTGRWFHFNLGPKPPVDPVLTRASQALSASRPTNRDESWHVSARTHSLPAQHLFDWMYQIFQFWKRICVIKTTWWQYYIFMQWYSYWVIFNFAFLKKHLSQWLHSRMIISWSIKSTFIPMQKPEQMW